MDPALLVGNFAICADCHTLLDRAASSNPALVKAFAHAPHLAKGAKCDECHVVPTHTSGGVRRPTMQKCFGCHSLTKPLAPPGECSVCHPASFPLTPASHRDPAWLPSQAELVTVRATHPEAAAKPDNECGSCHAPSFCLDCHGMSMPHPANWQDGHSEEAAKVGGQVCLQCHPDSESCSACHHPGYVPGGPPWWQIHPAAVQNGDATLCLRCHSTLTCAHCHTTGEYKVY